MSFNHKHSLGTPIVLIEGIVKSGIWRPPPGNPATPRTEEWGRTTEPTGAAPIRDAAGIFPVACRLKPPLLTELPKEPTMLPKIGTDDQIIYWISKYEKTKMEGGKP